MSKNWKLIISAIIPFVCIKCYFLIWYSIIHYKHRKNCQCRTQITTIRTKDPCLNPYFRRFKWIWPLTILSKSLNSFIEILNHLASISWEVLPPHPNHGHTKDKKPISQLFRKWWTFWLFNKTNSWIVYRRQGWINKLEWGIIYLINELESHKILILVDKSILGII